MRRILALLILLAIPAVAQFGGPMGGMPPSAMQGGGLLPGRGGDPLWVAAGPTKPTLDFDFAKRKDLTDAVSGKTSLVNFSRSAAQSPGTYVGADGLIHDAAVNLALYSEQFDVSWANSNSSDKANQAIAPDGKQTADKVIPNSGTVVNAGIYQFPYPSTDAEIRTFSVYAKSAEFSKFAIKIGGGDAVLPIALFNLQNGQIESVQDGSAKIENTGNTYRQFYMDLRV